MPASLISGPTFDKLSNALALLNPRPPRATIREVGEEPAPRRLGTCRGIEIAYGDYSGCTSDAIKGDSYCQECRNIQDGAGKP